MRVSQISVYHQSNPTLPRVKNNNQRKVELPPKDGIEFRGKFGAWVGGILGGAAVVATALATAPAAICLLGGGAVFGALGGDAAEDAVNGNNKEKEN